MKWSDIQSGGGGLTGAAARVGLYGLSLGWGAAWWGRHALYATGLRMPASLPVPVLSVGNLAVGGTGKTPFTAWLARGLLQRGYHPGILSRGYGSPAADGSGLSDEGALLRRDLGDEVPQVELASRRKGGRRLLEEHPATNVVLLDDGFQHWRLARSLDIVLLDATNPFGYGHLLPRGRLREPPRALERAGVVVLTRTERRSEEDLAQMTGDVARRTAAPVVGFRTVARSVAVSGDTRPPSWLAGRKVYASCGIGNPDAFVAFVKDLGGQVVGRHDLHDHAAPSEARWDAIRSDAGEAGAECVLITRKDAVKHETLPDDVAVLDVSLEAETGEAALWAAVENVL